MNACNKNFVTVPKVGLKQIIASRVLCYIRRQPGGFMETLTFGNIALGNFERG